MTTTNRIRGIKKSLDHVIKGSCEFMEGSSSLYITTLPGLVAKGIVVMEINVFDLLHDLTWPCVQRVVWLIWLRFFIVNHNLAKFTGQKPCGSSDTATTKLFYLTLQNHVIKESGHFIKGNSSLYIPTLPKLASRDIVLMDI